MKINIHIKNAIECLKQGAINQELSSMFFPNETPIPKECALWDYKSEMSNDKLSYAEIAKDILAFYNSYGGYLFLGVKETKKDEIFEVVDFSEPSNFLADLKGSISSYASTKIDISVCSLTVGTKNIKVIYIPQRPASQLPAFLTKNGPEKKPGKPLFLEKSTYFRQKDEIILASMASEWEFLNSTRDPNDLLSETSFLSQTTRLARVIPTNLPDRNLICAHLYGRDQVLGLLWKWIADELEPVRLLAGIGGCGKTSVAYEFASRFYKNAPTPFEQVLWLSAKRKQFRGDRNDYIELPETLYSTPRELLEGLCLGTAAMTQTELDNSEESEYTLQRKLRESLRLIPALIIVDDVDSLSDEDQKRVFELVQQISAGALSKFLLTTRANFAFSQTQCIEITGLEDEPYQDFVEERINRFGIEKLKQHEIKKLHSASLGSPLWTESIIRLLREGSTLEEAIKEWKGKPGEDARAAALRKELKALSSDSKRILYVAAILGDCSRAEIIEIAKVGKQTFGNAIAQLNTLFLVEAPRIIEDEPRFSVPEATALAVIESAKELVDDHNRLTYDTREFVKRTNSSTGLNAKRKVAVIVNQTMALISTDQTENAFSTVNTALAEMPTNADLLMLKGRCLRESDRNGAIEAFRAAYKNGQRKPLLFEMWHQCLMDLESFAAAIDVVNLALKSRLDRGIWLPLRAFAFVKVGLVRYNDGNVVSAVDEFLKATQDYRATAIGSFGVNARKNRTDFETLNDFVWTILHSSNDLELKLKAYDYIKLTIELSDIRESTIDRLYSITRDLVSGVDLSNDSPMSRAGRTRLTEAIGTLRTVVSNRNANTNIIIKSQAAIDNLNNLLIE
jgi:hypothetical protein